jgi:hypothetical protein
MGIRRAVTISLPASDPRSAIILQWIEQHPPQSDVSGELRGLLVQALGSGDRLARIESTLDRLLHEMRSGCRPLPGGETPPDDAMSPEDLRAAVDLLMSFE